MLLTLLDKLNQGNLALDFEFNSSLCSVGWHQCVLMKLQFSNKCVPKESCSGGSGMVGEDAVT